MEAMHEPWGYCWKWDLLGGVLSATALSAPVFLGAGLARVPRRAWVGVLVGGCVAIAGFFVAQVASVVLWNGFHPAICNRLP
jgi:hypothetical protein